MLITIIVISWHAVRCRKWYRTSLQSA